MPRNVVTLAPRLLALPTRRNRVARRAILSYLTDRYHATVLDNPERIEMHFPKRTGGRMAKDEVAAALDSIEPRWRRLYVLYPNEEEAPPALR